MHWNVARIDAVSTNRASAQWGSSCPCPRDTRQVDSSALWADLSKTFYNLGNIIVGFSTLQALAFVYSFYGPKNNITFIEKPRNFWFALLLTTAFTALYGAAVTVCSRAERNFLKKASVDVGEEADCTFRLLHIGRVGTLLLFYIVEVLQCLSSGHNIGMF
jgi:hypothetical protein